MGLGGEEEGEADFGGPGGVGEKYMGLVMWGQGGAEIGGEGSWWKEYEV